MISFVARKFGPKGVKDLEKISTALYVTKTMEEGGCDAGTRKIVGLKPHILYEEAREAVHFVDEMFREAAPVIRSVAGD
ncbi:hypothetical protein [Methanoculleus sp.]|uniref:hypothetical protein n=1 Tax=Methanoculleus sp. TaxID=90427 RepID=UPI001BD3BE8D|nr:hypothetical protein [Methanoculleus sp.]